jgi:Uma2 family endonuclease
MERTLAVAGTRHRFTVAEYVAMAEHGIIAPDVKTELLDGEVIRMAPIGWPHQSVVTRLMDFFVRRCGDSMWVWVQGPITLSDWSLPQPDLILLERRSDAYANGGPRPTDAILLVEVADSSLSFDRRRKLPLYAQAGVVSVWIVDVSGGRVLQFDQPSGDRYARTRVARRGGSIDVPCADEAVLVETLIG